MCYPFFGSTVCCWLRSCQAHRMRGLARSLALIWVAERRKRKFPRSNFHFETQYRMIGNLIHLGYRIGYPHDIPQKIIEREERDRKIIIHHHFSLLSVRQFSALYVLSKRATCGCFRGSTDMSKKASSMSAAKRRKRPQKKGSWQSQEGLHSDNKVSKYY